MTEEAPLMGLWCVTGWCLITLDPFRYAGTLEDVEETRAGFIKEGRDGSRYEIMPFDCTKTAPGVETMPTATQAAWLESIDEWGQFPWPAHASWRQTSLRLDQNGWMIHNLGPDGAEESKNLRLTEAGKRALARWKAKTT